MRSVIILGACFLISVFAAPAQKREVSDAIKDLSKTIDIVTTTLDKRTPRADLSGLVGIVTTTANDVAGTVDNLLDTITDLDAAVQNILKGLEADVDDVLSTVTDEVQSATEIVRLTIGGFSIEEELGGIAGKITAVITEAQALLADVQALVDVVSSPTTISRVSGPIQELLSALDELLNENSLEN